MFLLGERDVRQALSLQECLDINRKALMAITDGTAVVPSRLGLPYPNNPNLKDEKKGALSSNTAEDWTLIKPAAYYSSQSPDVAMGMKVISLRANNPSKGLPLAAATILLLDAASGVVEATISGTYLTVARTSAGPALAVKTFQPQAQHLVLFGAGAQAECHVELMEIALQRKIPRITIVNRSRGRAEALKTKLLADRDTVVEVVLLADSDAIASALSTADVVAATTNATTPLWEDGSILKKGCLITGIGSYTPNMQEVPESAVNLSHVIIDIPDAMEVGDLKHLGSYASSTHQITLAGDALKDPSGIGSSTDYIFYKAVGTAIQDVLTAQSVVERAKHLGIGHEVDMQ
jgi:ornithine cyclodeaminase